MQVRQLTGPGDFDASWVPHPGTVLDDRYRLDEMVDRGGMGVIMRGEHIRMKREVAVKLLRPDIATESHYRARFRREVDLAAALDHPNIVRCYDFGETDTGVLYLVMELLDGDSLKNVIRDAGRLGLRRAAALSLQLLDGLAAAHLKDLVHRDLKPGNAFVVRDLRGNEVVKLLDFGLAKSLSDDDVRITQTGAICGTASYLAPEAIITQDSTAAGDVYACGLIMLEMVLGRKVFSSWSMAQTFLQQMMLAPRIPRRIWDTAYGQLVARALSKHPGDRPANAELMYQELARAIGELPDICLEVDELPPLPADELSDSLLHDLAEGRARDMATLRLLPAAEPWDSSSPLPDEAATQRMLLADIEAMISVETKPTVQVSAAAATADSGSGTESMTEAPRRSKIGLVTVAVGGLVVVLLAVLATRAAPPTAPDGSERSGSEDLSPVTVTHPAPAAIPAAAAAADIATSPEPPDAGPHDTSAGTSEPTSSPPAPKPKRTRATRATAARQIEDFALREVEMPAAIGAGVMPQPEQGEDDGGEEKRTRDAILDRYLKVDVAP